MFNVNLTLPCLSRFTFIVDHYFLCLSILVTALKILIICDSKIIVRSYESLPCNWNQTGLQEFYWSAKRLVDLGTNQYFPCHFDKNYNDLIGIYNTEHVLSTHFLLILPHFITLCKAYMCSTEVWYYYTLVL